MSNSEMWASMILSSLSLLAGMLVGSDIQRRVDGKDKLQPMQDVTLICSDNQGVTVEISASKITYSDSAFWITIPSGETIPFVKTVVERCTVVPVAIAKALDKKQEQKTKRAGAENII